MKLCHFVAGGLSFGKVGLLVLSVCAACCCSDSVLFAQQTVRVDEDWELIVKTPDENSAGPQVLSTISPVGNVNWYHATFELNHQSLPDFVAGGVQLQAWNDEWPSASRKFPAHNVLHHDNEVIRWTQSMQLSNGMLTFEITNGTSTTWGNFGGQGYLKWSIGTDLTDLNDYDSSTSVKNSGVSYGANLVKSLVLKKVRLHKSDDTVAENTNAITVHSEN